MPLKNLDTTINRISWQKGINIGIFLLTKD